MKAIIDNYTKEELKIIVNNSQNMSDLSAQLGYIAHGGSNHNTIQKRLDEYGIDTSHFNIHTSSKPKTDDEIFIKDSQVSQRTLRSRYKAKQFSTYKCSICGQEPIWQGKELTLILDHIDGDNHNNVPENLRWVCPNCNQQLETTGYKNFRTQYKNKKRYYCPCCGKQVSRKGMWCSTCYHKSQVKSTSELPISREELKDKIRNTSFLQIGKEFNVSDNAIRKWCVKYGLPTRKRIIESTPDSEWTKV